MKKQHKKSRDIREVRQAVADRARRRDRRMLLKGGIALAVTLPLVAFGIFQYERRAAVRYDLSVIGNGQPTVVQVFDFGCAECRQLRENLAVVQSEFQGQVQFRKADRGTPDGAVLAIQHNAGHVTLLMFGADGQLRNTLTGVQDPATIRAAILSSFPARRTAG